MGDSPNQATTIGSADPGTAGPAGRSSRRGRAELLRLAAWFEAADTETAHALCTAAFALYPARHLGGTHDESVAATTSWWDAPAATPVSRSAPRGPAALVDDHSEQQARLRDAAEAAAHWRRSAAQEVRRVLAEPAADGEPLRLSSAAMDVLMELLTAALGSGDAGSAPVSAGDLELDVRLHVRHDPGAVLTLREAGGDLVLESLRLRATGYAAEEPGGPPEPEPGAGRPARHRIAHRLARHG
ncbi:DUF2397 family protein [Marinitenerispora sediminis]|uniref:DUF2397 family protein n=1 Tax=Marinitenerispora sediminis TaxID=1931232 RepID=A0A368T0G4_9ACTN|nr:DUF2397 family protein [Marinitenerispora sediminis]RCV52767.1 hypothetical protein DEF24_21515 [Marinitenerispora sediminis]RCV55586.1 hypothetical protein DEF28_05685 [Marinitenerispora sediminis]RCV61914.1 hypothetical protein DEF23_01125 [Marinitenerispora sediminis]